MDKSKEKRVAAAIAVLLAQKERWSSTIVARAEISDFSGGLFSPGHLANCDSRGEGIEGGFYVGRKKVYPVEKALEWMIKRVEV